MTPLPQDVARCLGRHDWTPLTDTCPVRNTCARYLAAADGDFGPAGRAPWDMLLCKTDAHEMRRPVDGGGDANLPPAQK